MGSRMVVVQEFRQLLPQAFVALAFVTENDGPFKEGFLEGLGQMAPEVERGGAKNKEIAVISGGRFRCCAHHRCSLKWPAGGDCPGRIAAEAERTSKIGVPPVRVSRIDDGTATLAPYPLRTIAMTTDRVHASVVPS